MTLPLAMTGGLCDYRESYWKRFFDLKQHRLKQHLRGAMRAGIRTVIHKVAATTKEQHGWAHETMTVLNTIQRSPYSWAKIGLHDTWQAEMCAATKASVALAGKTCNVEHSTGRSLNPTEGECPIAVRRTRRATFGNGKLAFTRLPPQSSHSHLRG
jgi:hypothetical protein